MMKRMLVSVVLGTALFGGSVIAQEPYEAWQDTVRTLVLSDTLETWGNLGGMTTDLLGFIYVSNFRDAVWQISPDGRVRLLTNSLYGSSGNAIDSRGDLYQANFNSNTITKITRAGALSTYVDSGLAGPVGLAFDANDNLFVCNCSNNTIAKVSSDGAVTSFATNPDFSCPNGITFDGDGNLYVVSFANSHVVKITPGGTASRLATLSPGGNAHVAYARGTLYVTRIRNQQIDRVTLSGEVIPFAGSGALGLSDGPAGSATFATPNGIAASPSGDVLYVNNLAGEWQKSEKGRLVIRAIDLVTLSEVLEAAHESGGAEAMAKAYRSFKADPARQHEHTLTEVSTLAFRYLNQRNVGSALALFQLNAESYPDDWRVHNTLGYVYTIIGQTQPAIQAYERALELDPDNTTVRDRLATLKGGATGN